MEKISNYVNTIVHNVACEPYTMACYIVYICKLAYPLNTCFLARDHYTRQLILPCAQNRTLNDACVS